MKIRIISGIVTLILGIGLIVFGTLGRNFAFADSEILDTSMFAFGLSLTIGIILLAASIIFFGMAASVSFNKK